MHLKMTMLNLAQASVLTILYSAFGQPNVSICIVDSCAKTLHCRGKEMKKQVCYILTSLPLAFLLWVFAFPQPLLLANCPTKVGCQGRRRRCHGNGGAGTAAADEWFTLISSTGARNWGGGKEAAEERGKGFEVPWVSPLMSRNWRLVL